MTVYLIGIDQKIPDWLIKIIFLQKVELQLKSDIKSKFGIMGFQHKCHYFEPMVSF